MDRPQQQRFKCVEDCTTPCGICIGCAGDINVLCADDLPWEAETHVIDLRDGYCEAGGFSKTVIPESSTGFCKDHHAPSRGADNDRSDQAGYLYLLDEDNSNSDLHYTNVSASGDLNNNGVNNSNTNQWTLVPSSALDVNTNQEAGNYVDRPESLGMGRGVYLETSHIDFLLCLAKSGQSKEELIARCQAALLASDVNNVVESYLIATKYGMQQVMDQLIHLIRDNFITVTQTRQFLELPIDLVEIFLSDTFVNVSDELDVFSTALRWIDYNKQERICHAGRILNAVRYEKIHPQDIRDYVEPNIHLFNGPCGPEALVNIYRQHALKYAGVDDAIPLGPRVSAQRQSSQDLGISPSTSISSELPGSKRNKQNFDNAKSKKGSKMNKNMSKNPSNYLPIEPGVYRDNQSMSNACNITFDDTESSKGARIKRSSSRGTKHIMNSSVSRAVTRQSSEAGMRYLVPTRRRSYQSYGVREVSTPSRGRSASRRDKGRQPVQGMHSSGNKLTYSRDQHKRTPDTASNRSLRKMSVVRSSVTRGSYMDQRQMKGQALEENVGQTHGFYSTVIVGSDATVPKHGDMRGGRHMAKTGLEAGSYDDRKRKDNVKGQAKVKSQGHQPRSFQLVGTYYS